jgi:hypothetical protein
MCSALLVEQQRVCCCVSFCHATQPCAQLFGVSKLFVALRLLARNLHIVSSCPLLLVLVLTLLIPTPLPTASPACRMLAGNFSAMTGMGDEVLKPFLQDVIQFNPLMRTMAAQIVQDPGFVPQLMMHVVSGLFNKQLSVNETSSCSNG